MRLGINIDHVATLRNARGGNHPDPLKIAIIAELFGASSGLGWLLQQAQTNADSEKVLAICLLIVLLFSAIDFLLLKPIANKYSINIKES